MPCAARRYLRLLPIVLALGAAPAAFAQLPGAEPTTVDLSADASRPAPNDLAVATVYFEASDAEPDRLARRVNTAISSALDEIRAHASVEAKTSGTSTFPVYAKDGRTIDAWRMRSDILIESRDLPALSDLLGRLQTKLALAGVEQRPSHETYKRVADSVAADAIRAFQARAKTIADTLGKAYRIRHLSLGYGHTMPPPHPMKASAMRAEAAPMPIEAGETDVAVTVNGTIELTD